MSEAVRRFGPLLLLCAVFALYLSLGLWLFGSQPWRDDELFEIDAARVAGWMTDPDVLHLRTRVHPLYVLLVQPLGGLLVGVGVPTTLAVQGLTAGFASAAVGLALAVALRWKQDPWLAAGVALLFGGSASPFSPGCSSEIRGSNPLDASPGTA